MTTRKFERYADNAGNGDFRILMILYYLFAGKNQLINEFSMNLNGNHCTPKQTVELKMKASRQSVLHGV